MSSYEGNITTVESKRIEALRQILEYETCRSVSTLEAYQIAELFICLFNPHTKDVNDGQA
jgi:hypothetical protein